MHRGTAELLNDGNASFDFHGTSIYPLPFRENQGDACALVSFACLTEVKRNVARRVGVGTKWAVIDPTKSRGRK